MQSSLRTHNARTPHAIRRTAAVLIAIIIVAAFILFDSPAAAAAPAGPNSSDDATATSTWAWPVEGGPTLDRGFEAPESPYGPGHRGVDIPVTPGAEVTAPADGIVHFAGVVVDRGVLTLDHGDGVLSSYEAIDAMVAEGEAVSRGDAIGTIALGPHCGATCLHVGVRVHGEYVNPMLFFGDVPLAVLLPLG